MNILILGAGQVGSTLATKLASDYENNITIVDNSPTNLENVSKYLDVNAILGNVSYPSTLEKASISATDLLIAVTKSDETNMLACQMAHTLYKVKKKIARIRTTEYLHNKELFSEEAIPIDFIITPENVITEYIKRIIEEPGASQIFEFEKGLLQLVETRVFAQSPIANLPINDLHKHLPNNKLRVVNIHRDNKDLKLSGETVIKNKDIVLFVTDKSSVKKVLAEFRVLDRSYKNIIIAGGGRVGFLLANLLELSCNVRIIESDKKRAQYLSSNLTNSLVLSGSASDERLLLDEGIEKTDLFIALTNSDEINVIVSILAKKMGAHKTIALVKKNIYENLASNAKEIDMVLSPDQVTSSEILSHIRKGNTMTVHSIHHNRSEAIEIVLDDKAKKIINKKIKEINVPLGVEIGSIVRNGNLIMPDNDVTLKVGDHLLIIITNIQKIHKIEKLFTGVD